MTDNIQVKETVDRIIDAFDILIKFADTVPTVETQDGTTVCRFCGAHDPPNIAQHAADCIWFRAVNLTGGMLRK